MKQPGLRGVMKLHLKSFNDEGVKINDATVLNTVLSESDGFGASNSKALFKGLVRWSLAENNHVDPRWPDNWIDLSVHDLAAKLLPEA